MKGDSHRNRRARNFILVVGGVMAIVSGCDIALRGAHGLNIIFLVWGLALWIPAALFPPELFSKSLKWLGRIMAPLRFLGPW